MEPITIVFEGVVYRRYPDAKSWNARNYYRSKRKGRGRLHVDVWRSVHGEVPPGCHIHHRDKNPFNNAADNLVCLTPQEHVDAHRGNPLRRSPQWLAKLAAARVLAVAQAGTEAGRETARRRCKKVWERRKPTQRTCEHCGGMFLSRCIKKVRFCSASCDAAWRRVRHAYHEDRSCGWCGKPFAVIKWAVTVCCSRSCAQRYRRAQTRAGV